MSANSNQEQISTANRLLRATLSLALVIVAFWLLSIGASLLIPLVLAIFVWYLIEALNAYWRRAPVFGRPIPRLVPGLLTALLVFAVCAAFLSLIASTVDQMAQAAPKYQEELGRVYQDALTRLHIDDSKLTDDLMKRLDLGKVTAVIGGKLGSLVSNGILVAMYVVFLLIERQVFDAKLRAIVTNESRRERVRAVLGRIDEQVRIYLGVKIFVSLLTAGGSYLVMRLVGLDFALFWAVLIFVLNFIPYIGSTVASLLPTLLALAQFGSLTQALIVFGGIQAVQMSVGYLVEPAMMGKSLNVSPLTVMLALAFWGILWGIVGMFIAVPVTVIAMIVCAQFESSRWISVLLSNDGTIQSSEEPSA